MEWKKIRLNQGNIIYTETIIMEPSGNPFQLYENSGYKTERIKKQSVVIDLRDDSVGAVSYTHLTLPTNREV